MFEVYKNRNILQFANLFVSQSHLGDDGSDAPRLLHQLVHFFLKKTDFDIIFFLECELYDNYFLNAKCHVHNKKIYMKVPLV